MPVSSIVQMISAIVFCTLIAASAAQSGEQSRVSWINDEQAPYHVSIWFNNDFICNGAMISYDYILTVASCVMGMSSEYYPNMKVKTGSNHLRRGGETHYVKKIIVHPSFNFSLNGFHSHDIAVIKLTDLVDQTAKQQGIRLGKEILPVGTQAVVTGWDMNWESSLLKQATSTIISNEACQEKVNNALQLNQYCTFDADEPNACMVNSGSPLVNSNKLFGILSWAGRCGSGLPEVYVDISPYRVFIAHAMMAPDN